MWFTKNNYVFNERELAQLMASLLFSYHEYMLLLYVLDMQFFFCKDNKLISILKVSYRYIFITLKSKTIFADNFNFKIEETKVQFFRKFVQTFTWVLYKYHSKKI